MLVGMDAYKTITHLRQTPYKWVIALTLALTETISYGTLYYVFTVFIQPMEQELGWTKLEITAGMSLSLLIAGLVAGYVGRQMDKRGVRGLMTFGALLATLCVLAWAWVESLPAFYLIWCLIGIASALVHYEPAFVLVVRWFADSGRSQALTLITFIAGFSSVIFIPLAGWLVETLGWREALIVLAGIQALTIPLHAWLLRDAPKLKPKTDANAPSAGVSAQDAFRTPQFWWLTLTFALSSLVIYGMSTHIVPFLISAGYAATTAANIGGAIGTVALPGRIIFTPLSTRISPRAIVALLFVCQALGIGLLVANQSALSVGLFVFLFGLGFGAIYPLRTSILADTYGAQHYGTISGRMTSYVALARAGAPLFISFLLDKLGAYAVPILLMALASAWAAYAVGRTHSAKPSSLEQAPAPSLAYNQGQE